MKILVCGGRNYKDHKTLDGFMDDLAAQAKAARNPITHIIHGDYRGADTLADHWARMRGIQPVRCPALWDFYEGAAGPRRNRLMLPLGPDLLVAFPGGDGTQDMWDAAEGKVARQRVSELGQLIGGKQ